MKSLKVQLKTLSKFLTTLSGHVAKASEEIEKIQKNMSAQPTEAEPKKNQKKNASSSAEKPLSVLDTVYNVIKKSKKGVDIATLKRKTGLESRQISNALYKLTKKEKIVAQSRGVYIKK